MISFDLKCRCGHIFEVWFRSSADHDDQAARRLIACPLCNGNDVAKAVMAPNVAAKGNSRTNTLPVAATERQVETSSDTAAQAVMVGAASAALAALPPEAVAMLNTIARAQAEALPQSRWVGRRFAEESRALHRAAEDGEIDAPPAIHGQATREEAEALADDGIAIMPLLVPIVPPEMQN